MRILYVEDDARDADITIRMLRKVAPSFEVETVSTIEDALKRLEHLSTDPLDLVLTDVHVNNGDGRSLLQHIRENSLPLAVVVVTGMGDEETAVTALKARADDYVVKSKGYLERLAITLESALNHYRADAARLARSLNVLYAGEDQREIEDARRHFAIHANHIRLDFVSKQEAFGLVVSQRRDRKYDVVVVDLDLDEFKAFEVLRELQLNSRDIPIVLLCSDKNEELMRRGLKLGATTYMIKRPGYLFRLSWEIEDANIRADLQRREAAFRASEERLRLAQEAARVGTWEWDVRTGASVWSEMLWDLLGLSPDDEPVTVERFVSFIHPEDRDRALCNVNEVILNGEEYNDEFRIVRRDGSSLWLASKGRLIRGEDGTAERMLGVNIDINERKLAEQSLKLALTEVQQLKDRLYQENIYLQEEIRLASQFDEIIGHSDAIKRVLQMVEQVAPLDTTALILGETGTGKELFAHAIHSLSARKHKPLVKVNCAALPVNLIESELFGHARGAFTGAQGQRTGRFEIANHGTIFLDEIGELPLDLQAKLLRVLEEGEFERVGDSHTINVNVRVIAATNRNLEENVKAGLFRSDLYYRLSIFPLTLPALRERREDIPLLVKHFVKQFGSKFGKEIDAIPQEAMNVLRSYPWPGNIRELRNVVERAVIVTQGPKLRLLDTLESVRLEAEARIEVEDVETLESSQYNLILRTLKKTHWRIEGSYGAAAALKINPSTLRTRMKKLGITKPGGAAH
ncbi:MAG: hypothetical protein C5B55_03090 [Blastocatellia bacterium]|nr:MAG: hypothetical protein C5B55_03090 [Blastocatellia bacterium]